MHDGRVPGAQACGARVARPARRDHHVRGQAQPRRARGAWQRRTLPARASAAAVRGQRRPLPRGAAGHGVPDGAAAVRVRRSGLVRPQRRRRRAGAEQRQLRVLLRRVRQPDGFVHEPAPAAAEAERRHARVEGQGGAP